MLLGPEEGLKQTETIKAALPVQPHRRRPAQVQVQRVTKVQPKVEELEGPTWQKPVPCGYRAQPRGAASGPCEEMHKSPNRNSFAAGWVSRWTVEGLQVEKRGLF